MAEIKNSISKVIACTGCGACTAVCPQKCITMGDNKQGFLYAKVDNALCLNCGKCLRVCPAERPLPQAVPFAVYGGRAKDEQLLSQSTSGGVFAVLSEEILKEGGWVCGCVFDKEWNAIHICTQSHEMRNKMKGTKYVQSRTDEALQQGLQKISQNETVLFCGTPCQVAAIKALCQEKKYNPENLLTLDIVCHGVPSPKVFQNHIRLLESKHGKLKKYSFRSKEIGWHGQNASAEFESGEHLLNTPDLLSYSRTYFRSVITRECCHSCQYANTTRCGDITIGDYWGIEKVKPELDDNKGVSLLLVNTPSGESALNKIRDKLDLWECTLDDCLQPNLQRPTPVGIQKKKFWKYFLRDGYEKAVCKTEKFSIADRLLRKLKNLY